MQDTKIVQLYWDRDESALVYTGKKYGTYCHRIAFGILHDDGESEECVNDTWHRTWDAIPPQRPNSLKLFLAKITRNLALDRFKARNTRKRGGEAEEILFELAECVAGTPSAEEQVLAKELERAINGFLYSLPPREANVFLRRYFFAESASAIGKKYSMTANHVAVILSRTRKKLREYLEKEGYLP